MYFSLGKHITPYLRINEKNIDSMLANHVLQGKNDNGFCVKTGYGHLKRKILGYVKDIFSKTKTLIENSKTGNNETGSIRFYACNDFQCIL